MAVPAQTAEMEVSDGLDPVQSAAARLFAQGKSRSAVARRLEFHLLTPYQQRQKPIRRMNYCMKKLRRWQQNKAFRDLVWQFTVERLDSRTPEILDGVADRAANGRVDAAKLALEVAGRYTPKGHDQPTAVQIVVTGVPRPVADPPSGDVVDGQITAEEG